MSSPAELVNSSPTLSIVIPAYNEEKGVRFILHNSIQARENLLNQSDVENVEIILVDDGSTDNTASIAEEFKEVRVVRHGVNRGYGAALKTGFQQSRGDLIGFLDADVTCDANDFLALYKRLKLENADLCVGSRLHSGNKMPALRILGNRLYALIINVLTESSITDSASGMRLFRRSLLKQIQRLPNGLSFTPALTSLVLCNSHLKITEEPIHYSERVGQSKLRVFKDGYFFLSTILEIVLSHKPLEFFGTLGALMLGAAIGYGIAPTSYYLKYGHLKESMVYRFLFILLATTAASTTILFGSLAQKVSNFYAQQEFLGVWIEALDRFSLRLGFLLITIGMLVNNKTIVQYLETRTIQAHWIYLLTGGIVILTGLGLFCYSIASKLLTHLSQSFEQPQ